MRYYNMSYEYIERIREILLEVEREESENINKAIDIIIDKIINKNQLFVFGASHAGIISEELFYRAGGMALFNPIFEPSLMLSTRPVTKTSQMERLEGYGKIILNNTKIKGNDLLLIHSVSGRNPVAIDMAIEAKSKGVTIIALTNVKYSKSVTSRHSSGKRLFELADIVLDNHGDIGDACISIPGIEQAISPTSTVIGSSIMNSIVVEVSRKLKLKNFSPPIFYSANIDGGDKHNKSIFTEYEDLIHYQ